MGGVPAASAWNSPSTERESSSIVLARAVDPVGAVDEPAIVADRVEPARQLRHLARAHQRVRRGEVRLLLRQREEGGGAPLLLHPDQRQTRSGRATGARDAARPSRARGASRRRSRPRRRTSSPPPRARGPCFAPGSAERCQPFATSEPATPRFEHRERAARRRCAPSDVHVAADVEAVPHRLPDLLAGEPGAGEGRRDDASSAPSPTRTRRSTRGRRAHRAPRAGRRSAACPSRAACRRGGWVPSWRVEHARRGRRACRGSPARARWCGARRPAPRWARAPPSARSRACSSTTRRRAARAA